MSSGHDPSPTEVRGRFATIPSQCRSVLPSLFPFQLCLAFLLPPALLPQQEFAGVSACSSTTHLMPSSGCAQSWKPACFQPASSHTSRDNRLLEQSIRQGMPAGIPSCWEGSYLGTPQPAPLNSFYYYNHFANYLIAAIYPRLSRSNTHRCGRPRSRPRRPTL